ncbi:hypothetical protein KI387_015704, partial [Taxus chinensis]
VWRSFNRKWGGLRAAQRRGSVEGHGVAMKMRFYQNTLKSTVQVHGTMCQSKQ